MEEIVTIFLKKNKIKISEFQDFIAENQIDYNPQQLNKFIVYLNALRQGRNDNKKMFFSELYSINKSNPFLLTKLTRLLDTKKKLNMSIIAIYEDIKKIMRTFDSGFGNSGFNGHHFINQEKINRKFNQIVKDIKANHLPEFLHIVNLTAREQSLILRFFRENEEDNFFNICLYNLAEILRDYDGHTLDDDDNGDLILSDETESFSHDYPIISHLKALALGDRQDDFLARLVDYLDSKEGEIVSVSIQTPIIASRWFLFLHTLLLHSIIDFGDSINFSVVLRDKTELPDDVIGNNTAEKIGHLTAEFYGLGTKNKSNKKRKSKRRNISAKRKKSKKSKSK